ncbi:MAG: 2-oxo acid dehydrogenase subunit E2 [Chloroflexota bacterium]|nr:2-oxo acid dehydrogenase subunit E2 [Chloroflexota bacterium]
MADISMPRLSDTMEEGTIATWLKKPGEQVSKGEVIAQIETDKATMDLTAFEAGTLQEILAPEGTTVAIGQPVARMGGGKAPGRPEAPPQPAEPEAITEAAAPDADAGAATSQPVGAESTDSVQPETQAAEHNVAEAPEPTATPAEPSADTGSAEPSARDSARKEAASTDAGRAEAAADGQADGKVRASPMARHLAAEHGLNLSGISGSGPQGRVIRADIEAALGSKQSAAAPEEALADEAPAEDGSAPSPQPAGPAPSAGDDDERVTLSQMRRTIARRMAESTRTVPHFFLTTTIDASDMVALRKQILEKTSDDGVKITFNDLIVKGAALAIRKVPEVNVSFAEDSLIRHKRVHIGVAVATERGLIVPVLRDVDQKSVGQIARETRDLAQRANSGKLQPADYTGGTFTISNLGMFGVEQFNAVINMPEAAILAVGAIAREPAEHEGEIVLRERLKLTLSVDHRALDGAIGARYLQTLKQLLEQPMLLLL